MAFWMIWAAVSLHPYPSESLSDERFSFNQSLVLILIRAAVFNSFHLNDSRRKQGIRLALMSKIWKRAWNYNTKKNNMSENSFIKVFWIWQAFEVERDSLYTKKEIFLVTRPPTCWKFDSCFRSLRKG